MLESRSELTQVCSTYLRTSVTHFARDKCTASHGSRHPLLSHVQLCSCVEKPGHTLMPEFSPAPLSKDGAGQQLRHFSNAALLPGSPDFSYCSSHQSPERIRHSKGFPAMRKEQAVLSWALKGETKNITKNCLLFFKSSSFTSLTSSGSK